MAKVIKFKDGKGPNKRNRRLGWSRQAVAELLGFSYPTVKKAIALGQVKEESFGGVTYIPNAEVERLKKLFDID
jgi:hypothetical protein